MGKESVMEKKIIGYINIMRDGKKIALDLYEGNLIIDTDGTKNKIDETFYQKYYNQYLELCNTNKPIDTAYVYNLEHGIQGIPETSANPKAAELEYAMRLRTNEEKRKAEQEAARIEKETKAQRLAEEEEALKKEEERFAQEKKRREEEERKAAEEKRKEEEAVQEAKKRESERLEEIKKQAELRQNQEVQKRVENQLQDEEEKQSSADSRKAARLEKKQKDREIKEEKKRLKEQQRQEAQAKKLREKEEKKRLKESRRNESLPEEEGNIPSKAAPSRKERILTVLVIFLAVAVGYLGYVVYGLQTKNPPQREIENEIPGSSQAADIQSNEYVVLVMLRDVPMSQAITADDIDGVIVTEEQYNKYNSQTYIASDGSSKYKQLIPYDQLQDVIGQYAASDLKEGELLFDTSLTNQHVVAQKTYVDATINGEDGTYEIESDPISGNTDIKIVAVVTTDGGEPVQILLSQMQLQDRSLESIFNSAGQDILNQLAGEVDGENKNEEEE